MSFLPLQNKIDFYTSLVSLIPFFRFISCWTHIFQYCCIREDRTQHKISIWIVRLSVYSIPCSVISYFPFYRLILIRKCTSGMKKIFRAGVTRRHLQYCGKTCSGVFQGKKVEKQVL